MGGQAFQRALPGSRAPRARRRALVALVAAEVALVGCNALWGVDALEYRGPSGSGAGGSGGPTVEEFCQGQVEIWCDLALTCNCFAADELGACVTAERESCLAWLASVLAGGRQRFVPAQAADCLTWQEETLTDCDAVLAEWPSSCAELLVGQVPEGGACSMDDDCVDLLVCAHASCYRVPGDGEPCDAYWGCAADCFCAQDGYCLSYREEGEACSDTAAFCAYGLYCEPMSQSCRPLLDEGGACQGHDGWCGNWLHCDPSSLTCVPPLGAGADCEGRDSWCAWDLYCRAPGDTCTPLPGPGQPCSPYEQCAMGSYCGTDTDCHPQLGGGADCTDDEQCLSFRCNQGTCETPSYLACLY